MSRANSQPAENSSTYICTLPRIPGTCFSIFIFHPHQALASHRCPCPATCHPELSHDHNRNTHGFGGEGEGSAPLPRRKYYEIRLQTKRNLCSTKQRLNPGQRFLNLNFDMADSLQDFVTGQRNKILRMGTTDWIDIYERQPSPQGNSIIIAGLVREQSVDQVLADDGWGVDPGQLTPDCMTYADKHTSYLPHGNDEGYEPLVFERSFGGIKEESLEISEEFRLFHNLYFDPKNKKYIKIRRDGHEHDVIRLEPDKISVRAVELQTVSCNQRDARMFLF